MAGFGGIGFCCCDQPASKCSPYMVCDGRSLPKTVMLHVPPFEGVPVPDIQNCMHFGDRSYTLFFRGLCLKALSIARPQPNDEGLCLYEVFDHTPSLGGDQGCSWESVIPYDVWSTAPETISTLPDEEDLCPEFAPFSGCEFYSMISGVSGSPIKVTAGDVARFSQGGLSVCGETVIPSGEGSDNLVPARASSAQVCFPMIECYVTTEDLPAGYFRLEALITFGEGVIYRSDPFPFEYDMTDPPEDVVLTAVNRGPGCTAYAPDTVTLSVPILSVQRREAGCGCQPGLFAHPGDVTALSFGIGGGTGMACMSGTKDGETGEWTWYGTGAVEAGSLHGETLSFLLRENWTEETEEEAGTCEWVLEIDHTNSSGPAILPVEIESVRPLRFSASGLVPELGSGLAFVGDAQEFILSEHPLFSCSDEGTGLCGHTQFLADAEPIIHPQTPCETNDCVGVPGSLGLSVDPLLCDGDPIQLTGFSHEAGYYIGDMPASTHPAQAVDAFFGTKLVIYCAGGTMRWALIDPAKTSECVVGSGLFTTWDATSLTGTIESWFRTDEDTVSGCCDGWGIDTWRVHVGRHL